MRPITLISALFVCLNLLPGTASADSGGGWTWPIRGPVITSYRNGTDPYAAGQHRGVDIGAPAGTRVVAATDGTVTFVGVVGASGLTVAERTADGRLDLSYLHLGSASVHRGQALAPGEALGTVGTSGRRSAEAPHLHFGVREAGSRTAYRDPLDFLPPVPPSQTPEPSPAPVPVAEPAAPHSAQAVAPWQAASSPAAPSPITPPSTAPSPAAHPAPASGRPGVGSAPLPWGLGRPDRTHTPHAARGTGALRPGAPTLRWEHASAAREISLAGPSGQGAGFTPAEHATDSRSGSRPAGSRSPAPRGPAPESGAAHPASAHPASASAGARHGLHLGWLAACAGLVAAATALGHPDGTRRLAVRGRARVNALLRPAVRRG